MNKHRAAAVVFLGLLVALLTPTQGTAANASTPSPWVSGDPTFTPVTARPAVLGVNYQGTWSILEDPGKRGAVLDALAAAGVKWVRLDMGWKTIQPKSRTEYDAGGVAFLDSRVREVRSRGMQILGLFSEAPAWASGTTAKNGRPKDPNDYARAAAWVANRYSGALSPDLKIDAMELWNEPDLADFWNPLPAETRISDFAALIKAAGPAIRAANPAIKVVVGGPTNVDTAWYTEFYKTPGIIGTYDALGVHPYQSPGDATPEAYDPKYGQFYMRHIPALDSLMTSKNDPAKIWSTEFGWSSHDNSTYSHPIPNYKRGVTEAQQADYLLRAMPVLVQSKRMEAAFWYSSIVTTSGDARFDNFGLLRDNLQRKPAYFAMKCASTGICGPSASLAPGSTLVPAGATWRYLDGGAEPGASWQASSFSDGSWKSGAAQLGYGDGDERTVMSWGSSSADKAITYDFRRTFDAGQDLSRIAGLTLSLLVDDGAVVYLNGKEVTRLNLPTGTITRTTRALNYVAGDAEKRWQTFSLPVTSIVKGVNTLAVEVHQDSASSSDISFDLSLVAK
jgi:hypothetical protein